MRQQNNCMETYIFGDGIVEGKSGTQRFEGTFVLAPEINNYGLYILSLEITSYPGIGCGSEVVETQSRYSSPKLYVRFSNIGDTMVIYYDAVGTSGFGPLERISANMENSGRREFAE